MKHKCGRCGETDSVFFFPYASGCGRDMETGYAVGGVYFELCDRCQLQMDRWMKDPGTWRVMSYRREPE